MNTEFMSLIAPAFIAGLVTFLAPCSLPLVPAYLGFISGADSLTSPTQTIRKRIFLNSCFYVLGFSLVFIVFGAIAGTIGGFLPSARRILTLLGGIFVLGIGVLGITENRFSIPFLHNRSFPLPTVLRPGNPMSSFFLGTAFAIGWTPCVGLVLGSILFLASTSSTAIQGALLLAIFSLGLAVPFLLIGLGIGTADRIIQNRGPWFKALRLLGSLTLIGLGLLLLTDNLTLIVQYGFRIFDFFNYRAIFKYL